MKRWQLGIFGAIAFLMAGFGFAKAPLPMEGVYNLKLKTLTLYDLDSKNFPLLGVVAELTESKPAGLTVQIDVKQMKEPTYGSFKLGNADRKTWFVMGQDDQGYWTKVYLDQNGDRIISDKEEVKSMQTVQTKERKVTRDTAFTMVPVPIRVSYKGMNNELQKKLYYFFYADVFRKKGESLTVVRVFNGSFMEGDLKIAQGKEAKLVKFRLYDADSNGCYNDFGDDLIYMDTNYDGFFKKNEGRKLTEYFDLKRGKDTNQYRLVLMAQPSKLAVVNALKDADRSKLEAISDPVDDDENKSETKKGR